MKILFNFIFSGYSKNDKKRIFKNIFSQININVIKIY